MEFGTEKDVLTESTSILSRDMFTYDCFTPLGIDNKESR
jgi:hypothetical protein